MNYFEMAEVYQFNNARRERLLDKANQLSTKFEKIKFVVDYFLNNLPLNEIMEIDEVDPMFLTLFKYDYAFLDDIIPRKQSPDYFNITDSSITLNAVDNDIRNGQKAKIYPTIFALKKGTCIMFANEIKRFAMDFDIDCKIISENSYCYDNFLGHNINGDIVDINELHLMHHYYNIITIDGIEYKIDIAGFLSALDYLNNNPEIKSFDIDEFYFSQSLERNPFNEIKGYVCPLKLRTTE